mmetsp:Transcript_9960/g.12556  ORF Transcript_9960/g.12556 Transcript_9960/m.12556 type:complete len:282 (+) Transcript_9960:1-846(+)
MMIRRLLIAALITSGACAFTYINQRRIKTSQLISPSLHQHYVCMDENEQLSLKSPSAVQPEGNLSRRDAFTNLFKGVGVAATVTAATLIMPQNSHAAVRITKYPPLEYLEPIYELKLSVDALKSGMADESKRPYIKKRLDKLFGGGIFSEKNYLLGLAVTYSNQIQYSESELKTYINLDKDERLQKIDSALKSLESLKRNLKDSSIANEETLMRDVDDAQRSISAWFAMVPSEDIAAVDNLFRVTRMADANRDGKLDAVELSTLPEKEREIWLKRIALAGD